jgi:hypothetical protein
MPVGFVGYKRAQFTFTGILIFRVSWPAGIVESNSLFVGKDQFFKAVDIGTGDCAAGVIDQGMIQDNYVAESRTSSLSPV